MGKFITGLCCLLISSCLYAELYICTDKKGRRTYQDTICPPPEVDKVTQPIIAKSLNKDVIKAAVEKYDQAMMNQDIVGIMGLISPDAVFSINKPDSDYAVFYGDKNDFLQFLQTELLSVGNLSIQRNEEKINIKGKAGVYKADAVGQYLYNGKNYTSKFTESYTFEIRNNKVLMTTITSLKAGFKHNQVKS